MLCASLCTMAPPPWEHFYRLYACNLDATIDALSVLDSMRTMTAQQRALVRRAVRVLEEARPSVCGMIQELLGELAARGGTILFDEDMTTVEPRRSSLVISVAPSGKWFLVHCIGFFLAFERFSFDSATSLALAHMLRDHGDERMQRSVVAETLEKACGAVRAVADVAAAFVVEFARTDVSRELGSNELCLRFAQATLRRAADAARSGEAFEVAPARSLASSLASASSWRSASTSSLSSRASSLYSSPSSSCSDMRSPSSSSSSSRRNSPSPRRGRASTASTERRRSGSMAGRGMADREISPCGRALIGFKHRGGALALVEAD